MNAQKADIGEIFSSVQGEGIFVGARQIFVRFRQCNMNCRFCDTPMAEGIKEYTPNTLLHEIKTLEKEKGPHHSVSLTGGEPLVYADFLEVFLPLLKKTGMKAYLETNGTLPQNLKRIIEFVDIIAMDFKLPSSTGRVPYWDEHLEFLKTASQKKVFVKAVVTPRTDKHDIETAVKLIKHVNRNIPFIMQPATPVEKFEKIIGGNRLLEFLDIAIKNEIENSRVMPQMHKVLGIK